MDKILPGIPMKIQSQMNPGFTRGRTLPVGSRRDGRSQWNERWDTPVAVVTIPEGQTWGQPSIHGTAQNSLSFPGQLLVDPLCHTSVPRGTHLGYPSPGTPKEEGGGAQLGEATRAEATDSGSPVTLIVEGE